jgi:hypothetical protein
VGKTEQKLLKCDYIWNWECEYYRNCRVSDENLRIGSGNLEFTGTPEDKEGVENLWFDNTEVDHIPAQVFQEFPNLKGIIVTNEADDYENTQFKNFTRIKTVSSNVFSDMAPIKTLIYRDDLTVQIDPNAFEALVNLDSVKISAYQVKSFPQTLLRNSRKLRSIYLHLMEFQEFNEYWFISFPSLESLTIFSCKIRGIPKNLFGRNRRLRYINFNSNEISRIDEATFNELPGLEHLELSFNNLTALPPNIFSRNKNLHTINLQHNNLSYVHPQLFAGLEKLTNVYLGYNRLATLPDTLFRFNPKITDITLDYNQIEYLPVALFDNLRSLEIIYLAGNLCPERNYDSKRSIALLKNDLADCYRKCTSNLDCSVKYNI